MDLLDDETDAEKLAALRTAEGIGRPLGSEAFLDRMAALMGRNPRPEEPARKPKSGRQDTQLELKQPSPETAETALMSRDVAFRARRSGLCRS